MSEKDSTEAQQNPNLEDCLKLLKGERDEQRLAGLLLVTNFCKAHDHSSLRKVYDAVGPRFLYRLLRTGTFFFLLLLSSFLIFFTPSFFFN